MAFSIFFRMCPHTSHNPLRCARVMVYWAEDFSALLYCFNELTTMVTPSAINRIAMINCKPSTKKVALPALIAFNKPIVLCTNAVNVTQSMMINGGNNILLLRPVTFMNTQSVINTSALNNWLAEPNNGQMFAYPILARTNPHNNVIKVAK